MKAFRNQNLCDDAACVLKAEAIRVLRCPILGKDQGFHCQVGQSDRFVLS